MVDLWLSASPFVGGFRGELRDEREKKRALKAGTELFMY